MNPEARCEVEFDRRNGKFTIGYFNCPVDEASEAAARKRRVEQITAQLSCPHGLTNRERQRLNRERGWLQRMFPETTLVDEAKETKNQKKLKAAGNKLKWKVRKADKGRG